MRRLTSNNSRCIDSVENGIFTLSIKIRRHSEERKVKIVLEDVNRLTWIFQS